MWRVALVAVVAACWTGTDRPPSPMHPPRQEVPLVPLTVKLERTPCMKLCPTFTVRIDKTGRVSWDGIEHVAIAGKSESRITAAQLTAIDRAIVAAQFFERDEYGHLPKKPACTNDGTTTTCSIGVDFVMCTGTSHSIWTITRDGRRHTIENDNCRKDDALAELEREIGRIIELDRWVGERE